MSNLFKQNKKNTKKEAFVYKFNNVIKNKLNIQKSNSMETKLEMHNVNKYKLYMWSLLCVYVFSSASSNS